MRQVDLNKPNKNKHLKGFTLVEVVITLVVFSICSVGLINALNFFRENGAKATEIKQAYWIAEDYLTFILSKKYHALLDDTCLAAPDEFTDFDKICQFDGLVHESAHSMDGSTPAGLSQYRVEIALTHDFHLGHLTTGLAENKKMLITVSITGPSGAIYRHSSVAFYED
jgi:prepilin-type N-terminal cleavage/methylation domain-containing protein